MKLLFGIFSAVLLLLQPLAASADEKLKIGFVYLSPVGDHGWTYQHEQGRVALEEALGDDISTVFVENVAEGPDAERVIEALAREGSDLIFATSFGYMNPTLKVAARFPNKRFEHNTGYKRSDNVATYNARFYEGRYVIGQIAARMSKTGSAGYIASFPIPEVVRGINAFMLGAQSVNPDFKLKIIWISSWFDPGKEADAATALIDQGVDMLAQHTDSTAPLQVANERGVHGFGQASDMIAFAPDAQLTAVVNNWGSHYIRRTEAALADNWEAGDVWGGLAADMLRIAPFTNMPDDVAAMANETVEKIRSGAFHPFTGPIYKQDGSQVAAAGEVMDDGALLGMNWYVKGIDGSLPQ